MSEDYLKMFTGVVLLIFVIIAGYCQILVSVWCNYESGRSNGCSNGYWLITERYELRWVQKNIYLYYVVISMVRSDVVFYKGAYDRLSHIKR